MTEPQSDVAIVGGGPAGLAAALILGRMRRRVVLFDADDPEHARSEGVHGLFGFDGIAPLELRRIGRERLRSYESVTVQMAEVEQVGRAPEGFSVRAGTSASLAGCSCSAVECVTSRRRWTGWPSCGRLVVAHTWELRDQPVVVFGVDAAPLALMMVSLSDDVLLVTNGAAVDPAHLDLWRSVGVKVREDRTARVEAIDGSGVRLVFADDSIDERAGLFFMPRQRLSPLVSQLGCECDPSGGIAVDEEGCTSIPGVFAAGDTTSKRGAVVLAAAMGSRAAYAINAGLSTHTLPA